MNAPLSSAPVFFSKPGVVCSAGNSVEELWASCVSGNQSGIGKVRSLSGKEFFVAKVRDTVLQKTAARFDTRLIRIADAALRQIDDVIARAISRYGKARVAVCVGSCDNGTELSFAAHKQFVESGAFPTGYSLEMQGADYPASFIAEKYGVQGAALAFSTACSSSAVAIIKAAELIQGGFANAVIAGGVDIVSDTVLLGFDSLEAVSAEVTNPFSKNRRGITLGEGAAFFVMAKDADVLSCSQTVHGQTTDTRGATANNTTPVQTAAAAATATSAQAATTACVKLLGWGESADAHHMTSPEPQGNGATSAMSAALERASISASDIDYINLHGTGTQFNDIMEARAVARVFGDAVPVSTTKPLTGHTLGAAGALEAAICYTALVHNTGKTGAAIQLPVQVWDGVRDEALPPVNIVSTGTDLHRTHVRTCMSNSFAFGGANACLILGV